jgi:RNA polymerase sigma factor (sigma-70 family)
VPDGPADHVETLIARYGALIRSAIARVAGPRSGEIGDDVVQRVTTALWKRMDRSAAPIEYPAAYLYRCAIREALREVERLGDAQPLDEVAAERLVDPGRGPDAAIQQRELGAAIAGAIDELTAERALAVRAHLAGFEVEEIMELHAWPYQKARNLIARGMADLRELLTRRGYRDG